MISTLLMFPAVMAEAILSSGSARHAETIPRVNKMQPNVRAIAEMLHRIPGQPPAEYLHYRCKDDQTQEFYHSEKRNFQRPYHKNLHQWGK